MCSKCKLLHYWRYRKGQILGRTQGINTDERPNKDGYLDLVITPENKLVSGDFESWEWTKPYVKLGYLMLVVY